MLRSRLILLFALICFARFTPVMAAPGTILVTLDPPGPIPAGQTFRVTYRLAEYSGPGEIDRFRFNVSFPTELFSYVEGSLLFLGSGTDIPWLAKAPQEAAPGFALTSASVTSNAGRVQVDIRDTGVAAVERGTLAANGFLVSFVLRALGEGTGLIRAFAYEGSSGPETFYGTTGMPAGLPTFNPTIMTVEAGQFLAIRRAGTNVIVSWPTTPGGFTLRRRATLDTNSTWAAVNNLVVVSGDQNSVTVPALGTSVYFQLQSSP